MTTTGCPTCDEHGPWLPGLESDVRELHRALHAAARPFEGMSRALLDRLARLELHVYPTSRAPRG